MVFRFYTNTASQMSRAAAGGIFITGLVLTGFGFLIYALPKVFAMLAAIVFFAAGAGCVILAFKILMAQKRIDKAHSQDTQSCRQNVQIHFERSREQ